LQTRKLRRCPTCAEVVQSAAFKCRYCGTDLPRLPRLDWLGREARD
jgi:tRNA(Ile2) C34 agmatinyltransferase TiaS